MSETEDIVAALVALPPALVRKISKSPLPIVCPGENAIAMSYLYLWNSIAE